MNLLSLRWLGLLVLLGLVLPKTVHAQGSVLPLPVAPGAEALGRGGAFAATADSPLALEYNVAGLAQLRGTQALLDGQLWLPSEGVPCLDYHPTGTSALTPLGGSDQSNRLH